MYKKTTKRIGFGKRVRKPKPIKSNTNVNAGYAIRRDNMVYMKQLHRGKTKMKYNYGNPPTKYPMNLRGFGKYFYDTRIKRARVNYLRGSEL